MTEISVSGNQRPSVFLHYFFPIERCLTWPGLAGTGRDWPGLAGTGRDWPGLAGTGRDWPGLAGTGRDWAGLGGTGRDWPLQTSPLRESGGGVADSAETSEAIDCERCTEAAPMISLSSLSIGDVISAAAGLTPGDDGVRGGELRHNHQH